MARKTQARPSRRGFGALRQLRSGRYQASYLGPDMVRHQAPRTFETKEDGEAWLKRERDLVTNHHNEGAEWTPPKQRAQRAQGATTLAEYAPAAIRRRRVKGELLKPRTVALYLDQLQRLILPSLGDKPLVAITPETVTAWYDRLDPGKPTQRAHAYSLLRAIMRQAVDERLIASNPCQLTGAGRTTRARKITPATPSEIAALADAMPDRLRCLILICAWCGLRYGEVAELRRRDVNLDAGVVSVQRAVVRVNGEDVVQTPKSAAGIREVHVPPLMLEDLRSHLRDHVAPDRDALLFPRPGTNQHLMHTELTKVYAKARESVGRPDLRLHDLRHSSAVLAAQAGATLAELMARLGHSTPTAALRYQHAAQGRDAWIAARMGSPGSDTSTVRP